jgi:hypothetical protein
MAKCHRYNADFGSRGMLSGFSALWSRRRIQPGLLQPCALSSICAAVDNLPPQPALSVHLQHRGLLLTRRPSSSILTRRAPLQGGPCAITTVIIFLRHFPAFDFVPSFNKVRCEVCKTELPLNPDRRKRGRRRKYCSNRCKKAAQRKRNGDTPRVDHG